MDRTGFNWVTPVISVTDMNRSLDYYARILGFDIAWSWSESEEFDEKAAPTFASVCRVKSVCFYVKTGKVTRVHGPALTLNL